MDQVVTSSFTAHFWQGAPGGVVSSLRGENKNNGEEILSGGQSWPSLPYMYAFSAGFENYIFYQLKFI